MCSLSLLKPSPKWQYRVQKDETDMRRHVLEKALEHGYGLMVLSFVNGGSVMFYYDINALEKVEPILKLVFGGIPVHVQTPNEEQFFHANAKAKAPGYA